jgi:hypothetical protein
MGARGPKTIDPTPQEIQRRTREIREHWSERTHRLRAGWSVEAADRMDQWTAPMIRLADLYLDVAEDDEVPCWTN